MIRNIYFDELYNDISFLEKLSSAPDFYRAFFPFLKNSYASIFESEEAFESGICGRDIYKICKKAKTAVPCFVAAKRQKRETEEVSSLKFSDRIRHVFSATSPGKRYCIGIGHYKTRSEMSLHMCVLIDLYDRMIAAVSFSTVFDAQITEKAIAHIYDFKGDGDFIVHSSQNPVYRKKEYPEILESYGVIPSMTCPGDRGGIMPVSTFFSALKRNLGEYEFTDIQDGVDRLSCYLLNYNMDILSKGKGGYYEPADHRD